MISCLKTTQISTKINFLNILTFTTIPIFEIMFIIDIQMPISCAFFGIGRLYCVKNLKASTLISNTLLIRENSGPRGNATINRVKNPY